MSKWTRTTAGGPSAMLVSPASDSAGNPISPARATARITRSGSGEAAGVQCLQCEADLAGEAG